MGRQNQCIQLVKVLYSKLPSIGKQLPTFPDRVRGFHHIYGGWAVIIRTYMYQKKKQERISPIYTLYMPIAHWYIEIN